MSSSYKGHWINGSKDTGYRAQPHDGDFCYPESKPTIAAIKRFINEKVKPASKEYEKCNAAEQAGWAVGQEEFIHGNIPGDTMELFLKGLRSKLAKQGRSEDFINGAEWGAKAEDE